MIHVSAAGEASVVDLGVERLNLAVGLAFDAEGSIFVVDHDNHRVLKVLFDDVDPTISVSFPNSDATIPFASAAAAQFSCADAGGSGLASCLATLNGVAIETGASIDTNTVGPNTLVVTAVDHAANTTTETVTFSVAAKIPPRMLTGQYAGMSGSEGSVARLYMAVFKRQPDAPGHAFWVERASTRMSMLDIANFFITSPEFSAQYDSLDDPEFVDLLYLNVMGRAGEAGGVAFWNQVLADGMPRGKVLLFFSESAEFKNLTGSN